MLHGYPSNSFNTEQTNIYYGIKLWLKSTEGITLNGSTVSAWADQSGNGQNAVQVTAASQPAYVANQLNGYPVLRFDGVNDYLQNTSLVIGQPTTFFIVHTQNVIASNKKSGVFDSKVYGDPYTTRQLIDYNGIENWLGIYAGTSWLNYPKTAPFTQITTAVFNGANSKIYENGVLKITGNPGTYTINGYYIGSSGLAADRWYNGDVAEIIIYNRTLNDTELQMVYTYLKQKYAIWYI